MDPALEKAFLRELELQCGFASIASQTIAIAIKEKNHQMIWFSVNALLSATGNISKIFWPTSSAGAAGNARGEHLRILLSIHESSPLNSREMRNTFEHFDERIEKWYNETQGKGSIDRNIGNGPLDIGNL